MGLGKRVRITRPPPGHEDWTDQKATVLTLVPIAKDPLEYKIRLDSDDSVHVISADCLEPTKFKEEKEEGPYSSLVVNDCMYCLDHRLEFCGECGVDHRMTNFMLEISDVQWDSVVAAEQLMEGLKSMGIKGRQAPSQRSESSFNCPANTALFHPKVNEKLILPGLREGAFDPRNQTWPVGAPTEMALRIHSNFPSATIPEDIMLPVRRMRETIVVAGRRWHNFLVTKKRKEPMARLMLQDEAQTQVLCLDLVLPIRQFTIPGSIVVVPIFVVRWAHVLAAGMDGTMAVLATMERNTKMSNVERELLVALLKENAKRLDSQFVASAEKHSHLLSVSFFTSISEEMQTEFYDSLSSYCFKCATTGVTTQKCARCCVASYCSRQCQKAHWKYHKHNQCTPPAESQS